MAALHLVHVDCNHLLAVQQHLMAGRMVVRRIDAPLSIGTKHRSRNWSVNYGIALTSSRVIGLRSSGWFLVLHMPKRSGG